VIRKRTLDRDRRRHRIRSTPEGHEERVTLSVDLLASMRGERLPNQPLLLGQQLAVAGAFELLEQAGGTLDVGEQEGDSAAQTLRRTPPCGKDSSRSAAVLNRAIRVRLREAKPRRAQPGGDPTARASALLWTTSR
jgi:hypothetical protein